MMPGGRHVLMVFPLSRIRAFEEMHLLTDAVKGITTRDQAFKDFFGTGWDESTATPRFKEFVPSIKANIQKAAALLKNNFYLNAHTVTVTCEVIPGFCKNDKYIPLCPKYRGIDL
jgi:hypothetical protein